MKSKNIVSFYNDVLLPNLKSVLGKSNFTVESLESKFIEFLEIKECEFYQSVQSILEAEARIAKIAWDYLKEKSYEEEDGNMVIETRLDKKDFFKEILKG